MIAVVGNDSFGISSRYSQSNIGRVGRAPLYDLRAGETCLQDLKRDPTVRLDKPYHSLVFYLPRAALDAIADEANAPRVRDLSYKPGVGVNDVAISRLGSLLLPTLNHPDQARRLFVDHVLSAVGVHVAQTYGGMQPCRGFPRVDSRHGRSDARRMITANLAYGAKGLARECRPGNAHFSRAFHRS